MPNPTPPAPLVTYWAENCYLYNEESTQRTPMYKAEDVARRDEEIVKVLEGIIQTLEWSRKPKWIYEGVEQDPNGCHASLAAAQRLLAQLGRKG